MARQEETVWGIHAGRIGDADTLFLKHDCVALGWHEMGDLSGLKPDREAFKATVAERYPDRKSGAIPVEAGQLFRFLHEMQTGDLVVYPSKHTREVHIGRIDGAYRYDPALNTIIRILGRSSGCVPYRVSISARAHCTKSVPQ